MHLDRLLPLLVIASLGAAGPAAAFPVPVCGNGVAEPGEACDGADLGGHDCASVAAGFVSGELACSADCAGWDVGRCVRGATVRAASCSAADVQAAVDSASGGDTVLVPAGRCTWDGEVTIAKPLKLQGSGQTSTVITASDNVLLAVSVPQGSFRITAMGFSGKATALLSIDGAITSLRVDHCAFGGISSSTWGGRAVVAGYYTPFTAGRPALRGVFDHLTFTSDTSRPFMLYYGRDDSWLSPEDYGTGNAVFIEDSSFSWTANDGSNADVADAEHGAKIVLRHNQIANGLVGWHDTGSTPQARSTRMVELYANRFTCPVADCGWRPISLRGGTGVFYDNVIPIVPGGYQRPSATQIYRNAQVGNRPWKNLCDATTDRICSDLRSHCNDGERTPCGGDYDCMGGATCSIDACAQDSDCGSGRTCLEKLDGQLDSTGWPCRDQTGRGQDDPVTHVQASAPVYWWSNLDTGSPAAELPLYVRDTDYIQPNRDCYEHVAPFAGAAGMGVGTLAERLATCATGVAYWATDQRILWKCTAADTWTPYYVAYPYPHPFARIDNPAPGGTGGGGSGCGCSDAGAAVSSGFGLLVLALLLRRSRRGGDAA